jgi:hypothetical protein
MSTPKPLALCLEDLAAPTESTRFLTCVALPGGEPGLTVASTGAVRWGTTLDADCELWVSLDDRLILYRRVGAGPVGVTRGPRTLDAPLEKPVVLVDQDEIEVAGRRLRVHVHGAAEVVQPPAYLVPERDAAASRPLSAAAAAAIALGTAVAGAACTATEAAPGNPSQEPIEVRVRPPQVPAPMRDAAVRAPDATRQADEAMGVIEPIEVRVRPPKLPYRPQDAGVPPKPDGGRR